MYGKNWQTLLTVWLTMALAAAVATSFPELWSLDIVRVQQGEWWRLASCHLVHLTWQHFRSDLLALGVCLFLCSRLEERSRVLAMTALLSACSVSLVLMAVQPVEIYGGLSGITAGLLSFAVMKLLANGARMSGFVLLACMLLKIFMEWQGVSASGVAPVWQAHCAGAAAGILVSSFHIKYDCRTIFGQDAGRIS
ncbi:MAG: rhombosortase [Pseudomonadota bacterium]